METFGRAFLLEEVVDFVCLHTAAAAGDDEGDPPPAGADYGRQLVLQRTDLQLVVLLPGRQWSSPQTTPLLKIFIRSRRLLCCHWP
jgi:hypothetical protein